MKTMALIFMSAIPKRTQKELKKQGNWFQKKFQFKNLLHKNMYFLSVSNKLTPQHFNVYLYYIYNP